MEKVLQGWCFFCEQTRVSATTRSTRWYWRRWRGRSTTWTTSTSSAKSSTSSTPCLRGPGSSRPTTNGRTPSLPCSRRNWQGWCTAPPQGIGSPWLGLVLFLHVAHCIEFTFFCNGQHSISFNAKLRLQKNLALRLTGLMITKMRPLHNLFWQIRSLSLTLLWISIG